MADYIVSNGEIESGIILENDTMTVLDGGTADNTTVNSGGELWVSEGGAADNTTVNFGGQFSIDYGTANHTTVNSDGIFYVAEGGAADNTTVNSGGQFSIDYGTANHTTVNSGGTLNICYGTVYGIVENGGYIYVDGGNNITFAPNAINDLLLENAFATVHSGTTANSTMVAPGGSLEIYSGGIADNTTIAPGGSLCIFNGGSAADIVENGGYVKIMGGANATIASNTFSGLILGYAEATVHSGTIASDITIDYRGSLHVFDGGIADGVTVNNFGEFNISAGGSANRAVVSSGTMTIFGTADNTTVSGGSVYISNGGMVNNTAVSGGMLAICGGTANVTEVSGRKADDSNYYLTSLIVYSGNVNSATVNAGGKITANGGILNDTTVNESGSLLVQGAAADGVTVHSGGRLTVSSGGTLTGMMTFEDDAHVYASANAIVDFDISELAPEVPALVNNLSLVQGTPIYTLTVSDTQEKGMYTLAEGVTQFDAAIIVRNTLGESLSELTIGGGAGGGENSYTLTLEDDALRLSVTERDMVVPVVSNIQVSTSDPTDKPVTVTADFTDNNDAVKSALYRFGEDGEWYEYADGITVYHNGTVYLKAVDTDDNESEVVSCTVANIGNLTGLIVSSGMDISVLEGETFQDTVVMFDGRFYVEAGGIANDTTVSSGGAFSVFEDGVAAGVIVKAGADLKVCGGGTATDIAWTPCEGSVHIESGATATFVGDFSGVYYGSEGHLVSHAATMESATIGRYGEMYVMTGGTADHTTVNSSGHLDVSSGGAANNTVININGAMTVFDGGEANGATVNNWGHLNVSSGGIARDTTVNTFGQFVIGSGGAADGTLISAGAGWNKNGSGSEGTARGIVSSGGSVDNTVIQGAFARLLVTRGGVANNTTVHRGCSMCVQGSANDITLDIASLDVSSGGVVNGLNVNSGYVHVRGGTVTGIVENGGFVDDFYRGNGSLSFVSNTFSGMVIDDYVWVTVHSGTTACDTTINYAGWLCVLSGGIASNTTVHSTYNKNENAGLHVYGGGTADSVTVHSGGFLNINKYGSAANVTLLHSGSMTISSDAVVNGLRITDGARLINSRGGFSGRVLLQGSSGYSIGNWFTYDLSQTSAGGIALINNLSLAGGNGCAVMLQDDQAAGIYSLADGADDFDGSFSIYDTSGRNLRKNILLGETVNVNIGGKSVACTFFLSCGDLYLAVGCDVPDQIVFNGIDVADRTVVNSGEVYDGATVSGVKSMLLISSGGTATRSIVGKGRTIEISGGGLAKGIEVQMNGILNVFGGLAVNTVNSFGSVVISGGGSAYNTICRNGNLIVSSSGTADDGVISGGSMLVSGGTANDTIVYSGITDVEDGGVANRTMIFNGAVFDINSGGTANNTEANDKSFINVSSGGTANSAVVNSRSELRVSGGGIANNTSVMAGSMTVSGNNTAKGKANATILYGGGVMNIRNGGLADDTTVYGLLTVSVGGSATAVREAGGAVCVLDGANVEFASNTFSGMMLYGSTTVHSGTTALDVVAMSRCTLEVFSGGSICKSLLGQGGYNEYGGKLIIYSGGMASDTNINNIGMMSVFGIADDTMVNSGGDLLLYDGATVHGVTVNGGRMRVSGGTADGVTVNSGGNLFLFANGAANGIVISSGGRLLIYSGTADGIVVNSGGRMNISGGTADGVTVNSAGSMIIENDGRITGKLIFANGAVVSANGGVLDFDLTRTETGGAALVNDLSIIQGTPKYTLTVDTSTDFAPGSYVYALADGATEFNSAITVQSTSGKSLGTLANGKTLMVGNDSYTLDLTDSTLSVTITAEEILPPSPPEDLVGTTEKVSWKSTGAAQFIVEYSTDDFEHVITVVTTGNAVETPDLPPGTYQWRVKANANSDWAVGEAIVSENDSSTPKVVQAVEDENDDLFFASTTGTWENIYYAQHVGSVNDWTGTNEIISADGKGRIQNLFFGSSDPNVLCLTDGENGDAIFVDDVYTELPEEIEEHTARLYKIQEVRAGFGDDIVDMTSQRFEYFGEGLTIRGGAGNDTIWANKGDNWLFGDAGNDRIVGASGNDVIAGGIGNDRMHGGGGSDIFTFGENWGTDTVEQLATGSVTLWFVSGDESNWNAETMTYTDGENSVKVTGVSEVTLKFGGVGDDAAMFAMLSEAGAFKEFTSQKIFEESKGLLA